MGYLRLRGLPINNPRQEQYQLWIFDSARGDQYPVDGGVFNMPAYAKEIVIPIVAKLTVHQATMFAVTIEQPGGVVVSSRERVVVITTT
jgi:anti-sigma-K factor RskA